MKAIGRIKKQTFDSYEELEQTVRDILKKEFTRYGDECTVINYFKFRKLSDERLRVYLYTTNNYYAIDATTGGYLGCVISNRRSRPGETWLRGRDLADGGFHWKTWNHIKSDIIWCELKRLSNEVLSRLELQGIDTNNPEAKDIAQLRREQEARTSEQEVDVAEEPPILS